MQDKISPQAADDYRRAVFASQASIATKEDLNAFSTKIFSAAWPRNAVRSSTPTDSSPLRFVPTTPSASASTSTRTPSIFIVTQKGYIEVTDITQLYSMLDTVIAENPAPKAAAKPKTTTAHKSSFARLDSLDHGCSGIRVGLVVHRDVVTGACEFRSGGTDTTASAGDEQDWSRHRSLLILAIEGDQVGVRSEPAAKK